MTASMVRLLQYLGCCLALLHRSDSLAFNVSDTGSGFTVSIGNLLLLNHTASSPLAYLGKGQTSFPEDSGNFFIQDYISERLPLSEYRLTAVHEGWTLRLSNGHAFMLLKLFSDIGQPLVLETVELSPDHDRVWLRVVAEADEEVYGGGEQFSYYNLRHRDSRGQNLFPIWTREQGVGRNKSTEVTFIADSQFGAGGDYDTTYFPQATFISSRKFFFHHDAHNYAVLDFRSSDFHEILVLGQPGKIYFNAADQLQDLMTSLSGLLGRMPALPDWIQGGAILGVQGGTSVMMSRRQQAVDNNITVAGLWIQDWSGKVDTPFGKRVHWDWKWDPSLYPDLDKAIANLTQAGTRVLGYINPSVATDGVLFQEAAAKDYLVKNSTGGIYYGHSLSIVYGAVDLTNPAAFDWYKNVIINNMIKLGLGGWMADFGEYLPADAVMHDGRSGLEVHNEYPVLWAKVNRQALEETGKLGEVVFFSRSGGVGISNYTTLMWNGDQNVDFSLADGVHSTLLATLGMGMSGVGLSHFDIGGYTTFGQFGMSRTLELLLRSAEIAVFTPVFRTHEGNQPEANVQWYDASAISQFARQAIHFSQLKNYRKFVVNKVATEGLPAQLPVNAVFADYQGPPTQFMFGPDLLVAPIYEERVQAREVKLPSSTEGFDWVHIWSGATYKVGEIVLVSAPIGQPPVFYRSDSKFKDDFVQLKNAVNMTFSGMDVIG